MRQRSRLYLVAGGVLAIILIITAVTTLGGFDRTNGGEVAVVRNGGLFDNRNIRQVIQPASSLTWRGLESSSHKYPAQQRFYTITAVANAGDRPGVDVVRTPSSDGVDMGIEGTLYFSTLNLAPSALRSFDDKFGTRTFTVANGHAYHAYDGDAGWSAFLDEMRIRPVIDNDLRQQISRFRCAELVSSCALVQNSGTTGAVKATGQANNGNIAAVQTAINNSLGEDLKATLGGDFFEGLRFSLVRISLPDNVQSAVNKAQAAFAAVSEAQARVAQAKADAAANEERQQGYKKCPSCAVIDEMKAIPPNVTTYAPGQNFAVTPSAK